MSHELPKDDSDDRDWIQFRGVQTSVTNDDTGIRFVTVTKNGRRFHKALPVIDPDDPPDDPPTDAVARPVAERLVESNPLVCWGVACEHVTDDGDVCGDVFASPQAVNSHQSSHTDGDDVDADDGADDGDA